VGSFEELPSFDSAVVAIGTFDGVHRGHRYLLSQARDRAHGHGDVLVVVTFAPNPQLVLRPGLRHFELTPAPVKIELLRGLAPDAIVLLPFTTTFAATSADDFMSALQSRVGLREMWMGEDFAFGHKRSGNVAYLIARGQTFGFSVHVIPRQPHGGAPVSSSRVRQAVAEGNIVQANDLLGAPWRLLGIAGKRIEGRLAVGHGPMGVEFWLPASQALPAPGLYAVAPVRPDDPGMRMASVPTAGSRGLLEVPSALPDDDSPSRLILDLPGWESQAGEQELQVALIDRLDAAPGRLATGGEGET
jgi:riboflavin kinase/FMN adenylyltransferase